MDVDSRLGALIRERREAKGLSQARLAEMAGTSQPTLDRIERAAVKFSRAVPALIASLDMNPRDFKKFNADFVVPMLRHSNAVNLSNQESRGKFPNSIPVYESHRDRKGYKTGLVVQWVKPTDSLESIVGAYGILISDDDMAPAYRSGDIVLVHPFKRPQPDSDVILYGVPDAPEEPTEIFVLRSLVGYNPAEWTVARWDLSASREADRVQEQVLVRDVWPVCHVVVARLTGR